MELEQVLKLLEIMESHSLDEVEVEQNGVRIRLRKGGLPAVAPLALPGLVPSPASLGVQPAAPAAASVAKPDDNTLEITSPMVGTFYRAPAPDADPFVNEGDKVTADSVVCIIEAMKVMNEIKAELEGEIVRILVENGESVEYGQPLMLVRKLS